MNDIERDQMVNEIAARVLREHAQRKPVDPERLTWAIGIAMEALSPKKPADATRARFSAPQEA